MRWLSCQVTEEMERWHRAETADRECCLRWHLSVWSMKPLHILARDRRPWWRFNIWHTGISLAAISLQDAFKHFWAWNHRIFLTRVRCSRWRFHFPVTVSGYLLQDPRSKVQDEVEVGDRGDRALSEMCWIWLYSCLWITVIYSQRASAFLLRVNPTRFNPCLKSCVWTVRRPVAAWSFNPLPARLSGVYSRSSCAVTEYQLVTRQSVSVKSTLQCQAPFGSVGM